MDEVEKKSSQVKKSLIFQLLSHVQFFVTTWTIAHQAPLFMGFSSQEYWSGLPILSPGDLHDSGIEPGSPTLWADTLPSELAGKPTRFINSTIYSKLF